jgi:hypothetical protein
VLQVFLFSESVQPRHGIPAPSGRNGGHLITNHFFDFATRKQAYGEEEAKKVHAIEKYTEAELLKIVREHNLGGIIDLSSGAHLMLFITEKEEMDAKADYIAAKGAGLDVSEVEWLSKETMQAVSPFTTCLHNI